MVRKKRAVFPLCWEIVYGTMLPKRTWKRAVLSLWVENRLVNSVPLSVWVHSIGQGKALTRWFTKRAEEQVVCSSNASTKRHREYSSMAVYWKKCLPITLLFTRQAEGTNFTCTCTRCLSLTQKTTRPAWGLRLRILEISLISSGVCCLGW